MLLVRTIMNILNILIISVVLSFPGVASSAQEKKLPKKKAINRADLDAAMDQSAQDQAKIKKKVQKDKQKRMNKWAERETQAIKIKQTGTVLSSDSYESNTVDPELDGLRKDIKKENTDVDFDSELMEVSIDPKPEPKVNKAKKPARSPQSKAKKK